MTLYEITVDQIVLVPPTSFAAAGLKERADIQRLLREQVEIVSPDTLIIAEEFGEWEDSRRRIDLLGLDRDANLVVIELKRTDDGGHMELQALRYAAMVSTMTFEQAVEIFGNYLARTGSSDDPRFTILDFLEWDEPDEDRFSQDVRIVLASAAFSREVTTAVIWLNDRGLDIRCVRLHPYQDGDRLLLDVQQVIPLPEAADYQVRLREKAQRERVARREVGNRDYTKFIVETPDGFYDNLPKRRAVLEFVKALTKLGVPVLEIQRVFHDHHGFGPRVILGIPGEHDSSSFINVITEQSKANGRSFDPNRYFCEDENLMKDGGCTFTLTNQRGRNTVEALQKLKTEFSDYPVSYKTI